jgi:hypothetical protein
MESETGNDKSEKTMEALLAYYKVKLSPQCKVRSKIMIEKQREWLAVYAVRRASFQRFHVYIPSFQKTLRKNPNAAFFLRAAIHRLLIHGSDALYKRTLTHQHIVDSKSILINIFAKAATS